MDTPGPIKNTLKPSRFQLALVFSALFLAAVLFYSFSRLAPAGKAEEASANRVGAPPGGNPRAKLLPLALETAGPMRPDQPVPTMAYRPIKGPSFELIHLLGYSEVALHRSPGGPVIETLGPRTEFGSGIVVPVVKRQEGWLGIQTGLLENGQVGWMRFDPRRMERLWTKYALRIDLSDRSLQLRYGGKPITDYSVTVGATGSETPLGRFAVTDAITFSDSPWYGCCALALTAHQPALPVGWIGGDRVAIHGTTGGVGLAESNGCVRATNGAMQALFKRVPLGTPVFIRT